MVAMFTSTLQVQDKTWQEVVKGMRDEVISQVIMVENPVHSWPEFVCQEIFISW